MKTCTSFPRDPFPLARQMLQKSVLCLQEVSTLWVGKLHTFFLKHDYAFITGNYGNRHNGYMGKSTRIN